MLAVPFSDNAVLFFLGGFFVLFFFFFLGGGGGGGGLSFRSDAVVFNVLKRSSGEVKTAPRHLDRLALNF